MLNKFKLIAFLFLLVFTAISQERFGASEKALNKFKNSTLQVSVGDINSDIDETLKEAMEKYWTFCPLGFVSNQSLDKDKVTLVLANYEIKSWTHYTFSSMSFTFTNWVNYNCHFDNLTAKNECLGIDKSDAEIKYKINIAVINLCAQVKFLDKAFAEKNTKGINSWDGFKERLKTTTILIPSEYLDNGITKNAFKKIKKKEFVSLKDIDQHIRDNKTKNYSVLVTYRSVFGCFFNIIDLETGDFIFRRDFGRPFEKGMSGKPDKIDDKDVLECIDKMYKPD